MTVSGALNGGTLKPVSRYGDLENKISIATAAAFLAKDLFKESNPHYVAYEVDELSVHMTYHFIRELRRQLSGDAEVGTSTFSPEELTFYEEYQDWTLGGVKAGSLLVALEALDTWLVDELVGNTHPELDRDYDITHPWRKTLEREDPWP